MRARREVERESNVFRVEVRGVEGMRRMVMTRMGNGVDWGFRACLVKSLKPNNENEGRFVKSGKALRVDSSWFWLSVAAFVSEKAIR